MNDNGGVENLTVDIYSVLVTSARVRFYLTATVVLTVIMILLKRTVPLDADVELLIGSITSPFHLIALGTPNLNRVQVYRRCVARIVPYLDGYPLRPLSP